MNATLEVKTDQHTYLRLRSDTLNNYDKALVYKDSGGDRWAIGMGSNFGFENPSPFLADFQIGFNPNNNLIGDNWTTWLNRFIIKTNGNVGIGTASPSQKLEVAGIVNAQGFYINGSPFAGGGSQWTTSGSYIYYNAGNVGIGTTSPVANLQVNGRSILLRGANENVLHFCLDGTNGDGYFGIKDSQDGSNCLISDNQADVGDLVIRSENRTMRFSADSGNTAHMSIQSSGNVGIGTTNPSYKLHINGVACAASFVSASDLRLKENINPLTNAIGKVSALHGIYFNFKVEPPSKRQVGVIAQEVEAVLPEAIFEDAEGYKSVDYSKLTPLLIEAVKELKAELKAQDKAKQAQIEALKALVCQDHPEAEICQ